MNNIAIKEISENSFNNQKWFLENRVKQELEVDKMLSKMNVICDRDIIEQLIFNDILCNVNGKISLE
jgi:deoxyadenosine/deoxycytidine kinase